MDLVNIGSGRGTDLLICDLRSNLHLNTKERSLAMDNLQTNGHSSLQNGSDDEFELMGDMPREDPIIVEVKI